MSVLCLGILCASGILFKKKIQFMQLLRTRQYFKKKSPKKLLIIGQFFLVLPKNQPISQFLFHKNCSPCNLCIMTLVWLHALVLNLPRSTSAFFHSALVSFHFQGYFQSLEVHSSICKSVDKKMNEGPTLIKASTKAWSIETFITYQSNNVAFYFDWFCKSILEVLSNFP